MRWVPQAAQRPHHCAAIPFIGNHNGRGFFDTGIDLPGWDPHVYVSVEAVEEMATQLGWAPKQVSEAALREVADRDDQIQTLKAQIANIQAQLDAIETLRNAGFKARERKAAA